ncbi:unnamed protein product [Rotaria socialis]|uniref:Uncharacterized protein n=1 Tax=Rotaria socialis TaxID=392032 RepID=A0A821SLL5_9BILA|nr:unnamed protein product [Rotaria socialis]
MKIKWLDLESSSMKHILCGADYPDLYGLSLYNIKEETAGCLFIEQYRDQCHVYSYPFLMQYYDDITNNFPRGLYRCVRVVSLYDEHPFENEFFIRIAQSFPFMEELSLINRHSQNHKTI